MSLHPVETEFGPKTRIHQSSCNQDYSCLEGDCPSFVTVAVAPGTGLALKKPPVLDAAVIPEPLQKVIIDGSYAIYIPGVGGTGVVTVNALLCYAALMEGKSLLNLDQTGLAQKGGAVLSNVILTEGQTVAANKVGMGTANLYLVLDALGGVTPVNLDRAHPARTVAVVNTTPSPTGEMIRNNSILFPTESSIRRNIDPYTKAAQNVYVDAGTVAEGLFGDHMATNLFMLGIAYQAGLIPLAAASIEQAIALNGVAVQQNQQAFRYGRRYVCEPQAVLNLAVPPPKGLNEERAAMLLYLEEQYGKVEREAYFYLLKRCEHLDEEAQRLLAIRIGELIDYQDVAYTISYVDFVLDVAAREAAACPGRVEFTHAVIRQLFKVMAYKDEYEVARLHLKQAWRARLTSMFAEPQQIYYHFHPPLLRSMGLQRKLKLGPWFTRPLRLLRRLKTLRGHRWDPFGYAQVRRVERQLIPWYRQTITQVLAHLDDSNHALAVVIANSPDAIRGYEEIKLRRLAETQELVAQHLGRFTASTQRGELATPR
jgi:indolepyruvate ferredoxin oxidoreductase